MRLIDHRRGVVIAAVVGLMAIPAAAVATHVFTDVADTNIHAPGIEYLAGTGVTAGCTTTRFCPGDDLTRGQMATFLYRASGHAPGIDPSVNAAEVGGAGIGDLVTGAVSITRGASDAPVVSRSLNNVNGTAATITGSGGLYHVDPGFDASGSFVSCTVNTNFVDTRDAVCTINTLNDGTIRVRTTDSSTGSTTAAEFHLLIVGMG